MDMDEEAEACAIRELKKETGLQLEHMKQIGAFTDVDRDPRGRTVSIAYSALVDKKTVAAQARWFPIAEIPA